MSPLFRGVALGCCFFLLTLPVSAHDNPDEYSFDEATCSMETCPTLSGLVGSIYPVAPTPFNASDGPLCTDVLAGPQALSACGAVRLVPSREPCCMICCNASALTTATSIEQPLYKILRDHPAFLGVWMILLLSCVFAAVSCAVVNILDKCFPERYYTWLEPGCRSAKEVQIRHIEPHLAAGKEWRPPKWYHCNQRAPSFIFYYWIRALCPLSCVLFVIWEMGWFLDPTDTFELILYLFFIRVFFVLLVFCFLWALSRNGRWSADAPAEGTRH